jgi:hypothetical protein
MGNAQQFIQNSENIGKITPSEHPRFMAKNGDTLSINFSHN